MFIHRRIDDASQRTWKVYLDRRLDALPHPLGAVIVYLMVRPPHHSSIYL